MPRTRTRSPGPGRRKRPGIQGRLKAHDPFELIRWLALSQTDPRKALAELVQNSLDASARSIRITRFRHKGVGCLRIFDDGEGVIPELDRPDALRYIATNIGHSRKCALSPQERLQLLTQGQYGIGLLGFWSIGDVLEMRSSVPGQRPHRLLLYRDEPTWRVEPLTGRLPLEERWTEVLITDVHPDAQRVLVARRAAEYLAAELRGQLLARDVDVAIEDRISRGRAQKRVPVKPRRFLGERIAGLEEAEVPGFPPVRLEIYWTGEREDGTEGIGVYGAGTQVADGFQSLAPLGLDRPPWTDARLNGLVDFPAFHIAPGSRRGIIVDEAATAFAQALAEVEPVLCEAIRRIEDRRAAELEKSMIRDLQRAFRDFYRNRPRYSALPVSRENDRGTGGDLGTAPGGESGGTIPDETAEQEGTETEAEIHLLPPGPLFAVRARPKSLFVAPGAERRVKATAVDATGRPIGEPVEWEWVIEGGVGTLRVERVDGASTHAMLSAVSEPCDGWLHVTAIASSGSAVAEVPVSVTDDIPGRSNEGVPDPELVDAPGERWRSRLVDGRWQVNSGHADFRAVEDRPALKLRYLAMLFAKEVVANDHGDPRFVEPLEQLVEVAAYADRRLVRRGRRGMQEEEDVGES